MPSSWSGRGYDVDHAVGSNLDRRIGSDGQTATLNASGSGYVWNMDARAGAIIEAEDAGAELDEIRASAAPSQISTTFRYSRGAVENRGRSPRGAPRREERA
jgi:hypothetical protein